MKLHIGLGDWKKYKNFCPSLYIKPGKSIYFVTSLAVIRDQ